MNIVYFGSAGALSTIPLLQLLETDHTIAAVAAIHYRNDNSHNRFQTLHLFNENTSSIVTLATINQIPVINLSTDIIDNTHEIAAFKPDVILVSCFAGKIPEQICSLAKFGCFNLHPSLLPKFRGPTPLFWQFKAGINDFGISLHRVTQQWDAGNIIGQREVEMPTGINYIQACRSLALAGSELILTSLQQLQENTVVEITQNDNLISYQTQPNAIDFEVSANWSAKRIYNFICATRNWSKPYPCSIENNIYRLLEILDYNENGSAKLWVNDNQICFPCHSGYLTAKFDHTQNA